MERDSVFWFRTPAGEPFYSKGVNVINGGSKTIKSLTGKAFYWRNHFPSPLQWRESTEKRLVRWGFNTRGAWSDPSSEFSLPLMVELDLGNKAMLHWVDPFDPRMPEATLRQAQKLTAPYRKDPRLIGYFTDNEVGWWNSPLFRWYLEKGWENHTKRVLWQLLYNHYGGQWDRLKQDWVPQGALHNFTELRQLGAQLKLRPGGGGIHLVNQFTYLCAQRYYQLVHQAIRQVHADALILGDRLPLYYHQDAVRAMADYVDVISTNYNVDTSDGWVAPYYFEGLQRLSQRPVLVSEFFFAAHENRSGNRNAFHGQPGHLMTVGTQAERAYGVAKAVRNFASFPNVVGTHWFQYADEPTGGRDDGEDYNMGLVDIANRPYEQVTDAFRSLNPQLDRLHQRGGSKVTLIQSESDIPLPHARRTISLNDNSLTDWDKAATRLGYFHTPKPYVPFADVHLAWDPEGLYIACLAQNYMDLDFLGYDDSFPLSETFRLHVLIGEDQATVHHYAIHLVPRPNSGFAYNQEMRIRLEPRVYRYIGDQPAQPMNPDNHVQRLDLPLPHIALESFLPAKWFGFKRFQSGQKIQINLKVVSFYRELTMTLSSPTAFPNKPIPGALRTFILQKSTP